MSEEPKPRGWYLGLRYMRGEGLIARAAEPIGTAFGEVNFVFADDALLASLNWREVALDWWRSIAVGGHLILWLPDCRYAETGEAARIVLDDVAHLLDGVSGWRLCEEDLIDGHIFVVWEKRADAAQWRMPWRKQPNHILVARTGGFGDALMAASVLPALEEQGATISMIVNAQGYEVLREDPHVDEWIVLGEGQLPDKELPYYWQAMAGRFDRFINMTHSVEGELLKQPRRADYFWDHAQRRALCDRSYLAQTHAVAGASGPYRVKFYATEVEKTWARSFKEKHGPFVLWSLRGSAVHKWWPHAPQAVCQVLAQSDLDIVLVGGADAVELAADVEEAVRTYTGATKRLHNFTGSQSVRETMALAQEASVVAGPETGVLHAVGMERVPKVVLLSHSSPRNLTDDWINATALEPKAACYPCHRLHFDHQWCPIDVVTGAALCAARIEIDKVVTAVLKASKKQELNMDGKDHDIFYTYLCAGGRAGDVSRGEGATAS